jgi:hypothetical protein
MTPVTEWLALLRVHEGGVTRQGSCYLNYGRPVIKHVADALNELVDARILVLGPANEYGQAEGPCHRRSPGPLRRAVLHPGPQPGNTSWLTAQKW